MQTLETSVGLERYIPATAVTISNLPAKLRELVAWYEDQPPFNEVVKVNAREVESKGLSDFLAGVVRPVIVVGYLAGTPLEGLTFEDVCATAGHHFLDPSDKPDLVLQNYGSWIQSSKPMLLKEYVDDIVLAEGNFDPDPYKLYRNIRVSTEFRQALGLIRPGFLSENEVNPPCIWLGRKGSHTGLHTDPNDNFVLAAIGSKKFYLFAPSDLPNLYFRQVGQSAFLRSPLDPRKPDNKTYPRLELTRCVTADLNAGDLLFLPLGWPHFVECCVNAFSYNYWLNSCQTPFFKR